MIVATPLDLPVIAPDNWEVFWSIWNREAKNAVKVRKNTDYSNAILGQDNLWSALDIYKTHDLDLSWQVPFYDIKEELPMMHQAIVDLPFKYVHRVRILNSLQDIDPHTDDGQDKWAVRALLHCNDTEPQWYFTKPGSISEKKFFSLPSNTNWFAYNDKHCWHGSIFKTEYPKLIIQVFMFGKDNPIINSSISKYKDYTIDL